MVYFYHILVYLDIENHPKDQLTLQQWWDEKLYASRENYGCGVQEVEQLEHLVGEIKVNPVKTKW